ncbi:kinase-like protein [Agrocybe pediades]|nr:kinase-like protein [Agrocybe pediades]
MFLETSRRGQTIGKWPSLRLYLRRMGCVHSFRESICEARLSTYYPTSIAHPRIAERFRLSSDASPDDIETKISALRILAAELCIAISFLHKHGIVHQNVKPANIMISRDGHAILGDFGASRMLPAPNGLPKCMSLIDRLHVSSSECEPYHSIDTHEDKGPKFGRVVLQPNDNLTLTPFYAAPELLERDRDAQLEYDEKVDWWSLGLTLYEMVVGVNSFSYFCGLPNQPEARIVEESDKELYDFLGSLLVRDANERLSGDAVLQHPFFDPLHDMWDAIKSLKHPPCLCPPRISFFAPKLSRDVHIDDDLRRQSVHGESTFGHVSILQSSTPHRVKHTHSQNITPEVHHILQHRLRSQTYPEADTEDVGSRGSATILQSKRPFVQSFSSTDRSGLPIVVGPAGSNHRRAYSGGGYENGYSSLGNPFVPTSAFTSERDASTVLARPDAYMFPRSESPVEMDTNRSNDPHRENYSQLEKMKSIEEACDADDSFNDSGLEFPVGELVEGWGRQMEENGHSSQVEPPPSMKQNLPQKSAPTKHVQTDPRWTFEENLTISMLREGATKQYGNGGRPRRVSSVRRIANASARLVSAIKRRLMSPVPAALNARSW